MHIHDLIGIGFGPSNLALAIALQENQKNGPPFDALFIERQADFSWHQDMLLNDAHMQISYLKDLVTLRNPCSRFTFVNYLHEQGRLATFINLKTFFPSRREFNHYLTWAAGQFKSICAFGEDVLEVQPVGEGENVEYLRVLSKDSRGTVRERLTRHLVLGIGGSPRWPSGFFPLAGHPQVFHSSAYLSGINALPRARKVAVIGAGQSAVEIFVHLHNRASPTDVDLIMRARAIRPSDDSPFVNEIFNADFTDYVFRQKRDVRAELLQAFMNTNYAVADLALIEQIFKILYEQKVMNNERHQLLRRHEVVRAKPSEDGVELLLRDLDGGVDLTRHYDAVVLATGYERAHHRLLLAPIDRHLGDMTVDRNYRIQASPEFRPGIYLQGACEDSHGLSDTLLSVIALRAQEIAQSLVSGMAEPAAPAANRQMVAIG